MGLLAGGFAELHGRSAFSFLEGSSQPEVMVRRAAELGYESVAITDRMGFYGSARAHHAARECGVRALVGAMVGAPGGGEFPVICATRDGYRLLSRFLTDLHLVSGVGELVGGAGDLLALTGDREGPVCRYLLRDDRAGALRAAEWLVGVFGKGNVYVEMCRHGLRDEGRLNRGLRDLADHLGLRVVASNAPLYARRGDRRLADAFSCLRHGVPLDGAGRLLAPNGERFLKSPGEMVELFRDVPGAVENAVRLAERVGFTLENLDYRFPDYPDGRGYPLSLGEQSMLLRRYAYEGAGRRYGVCSGAVKRQLEHELAMIQRLGFPGYFLIVNDLVEYARGRGILCQGRGSAANSVVCYALGITAVDPVGGGLLFERFLSDNRKSWPDIDIDFPSGERREEVIQHVFRKYGERNAAMTANVICYRRRSAFREMSKVLGFPARVADFFSSRPSDFGDDGLGDEGAFVEKMAGVVPAGHPRLGALWHLYRAVLGMPRHLGQHSGGMIVCDHGLDFSVPLERAAMAGRNVVQWDKDDCEDMGIVKIDLLGLGMLAAMEDMLVVCSRRGTPVDLARIPMDDPAVFEMLCKADTVGTFQVESRAQMATLPVMRPQMFYDLVIEVAIIRPGPIVGDLVHPYLNRRSGKAVIDYIHPSCEGVLKRTLGVPLFQEQVLRMAMEVAGFSGAEADELRRAMAFKRDDCRMERVRAMLEERMVERGVGVEVRRKVVDSIGSFALYGFPESHAISFALIAYASCWLKVHHPAAFYAGLLNHQPMGFYSVNTLLEDAKRHGMRVRPVSCVASGDKTEVVDERTLRLGLRRLKGLSGEVVMRVVRERGEREFSSLEDFLGRVRPSVKERRLLAQAGALNDLEGVEHRRQALWQVELPLFDDLLERREGDGVLRAMDKVERLCADFSSQGATTGPHPMRLWREVYGERGVLRAADLEVLPHGVPVTVAGMVICRQRPGTAKGHCFISLEDETGIANLFVPKKMFDGNRVLIGCEPFLRVGGILQRSEGERAPTVFVKQVGVLGGVGRECAGRSHDFH